MKKKKSLVALLLVAIIGVVGGTFAYFTSNDTFANVFRTKAYNVEVKEVFTSPDDWTPGTTTSKTVTAKNNGDVDAAVRIYYEESWVNASGDDLSLTDSQDRRASIINFPTNFNTKWTASEEGGRTYYYYKTKLAKNQTTSAFMESVTFNPNVTIGVDHNCDTSVSGEETCTTVSNGYGGGTYTLTLHVQTVQYDQYQTAWGTTVNISNE